MTSEERDLITGLFNRLRDAEAKTPAKDREAEGLIGQLTGQLPSAPYLLAQTTLVQEHALANAQARIQALERQVAQMQKQPPPPAGQSQGGGSFLSNLFGHHSTPPPVPPPPQPQQVVPPPVPPPQQVAPGSYPYPATMNMAPSSGGGFLRGALTTAAGVAGGALLFQGIENLIGHNSGPFGGGLGSGGGGGFFGGGGSEVIENREVINNYYNEGPGQSHGEGSGGGGGAGGGDAGSFIPAGAAENPANPGSEENRFDDRGFDANNPFNAPADDNSLYNAPADNSSLDNTLDNDNPDAGGGSFLDAGDNSGSDFSGGDFSGGDNFAGGDSDDDSGTV